MVLAKGGAGEPILGGGARTGQGGRRDRLCTGRAWCYPRSENRDGANRMARIAKRMAGLGTETAFEILARARVLEARGRDVVHLEIGEPDFDTPANVVEAAIRALREGWTHYGPSAGLPPAREAIAEFFSRDRGV